MAIGALDCRQHRAMPPQWQAAQTEGRSVLPLERFLGDIGLLVVREWVVCEWRAELPAQAGRIFTEDIK
jgi:hypothetical protein